MKNSWSVTHGQSNTRLYKCWKSMKSRCSFKNKIQYYRYGGRGITICKEWKNDFVAFRDWALANGYSDKLTLDRINNNKGYSPENCRWVTHRIQGINREFTKNKTGFRGIKKLFTGKYMASIQINKVHNYLGTFDTPEEAFEAYRKATVERNKLYWKEFQNNRNKK